MGWVLGHRSMTATTVTADPGDIGRHGPDVRVQILRVAGCPHVEQLRAALDRSLDQVALDAFVEEIDGPYPSPTLLVDGIDVTGRQLDPAPSCRLGLPTEYQIIAALSAATRTRNRS